MIHIVLLVIGKVLVDIIPGVNQTISWTTVLQLYMLVRLCVYTNTRDVYSNPCSDDILDVPLGYRHALFCKWWCI